jgi:hypothetical protein
MLRQLVGTITAGALIGCGATWPTRAAALAEPGVHQITTIDVLPVDLEVWTQHGSPEQPDVVRDQASMQLLASAVDSVQQRSYAIDGLIDWNGAIDGRGTVMDPWAVDATLATLARYDTAAGPAALHRPDPQLPARLGTVSGADATLYIGGWAYVAAPHASTGETIAKGVLIAVAIVAIVAIAIVASKDDNHGGSHGGGSHSSGGSHVAGHSAPVFHDHRVAAADNPQVASIIVRDHRGIEGGHHESHVSEAHHRVLETAIDIVDSIDPQEPVHPDWSSDVPDGDDSAMYVEMTLVDNASGMVLWHAHQRFPASAASKQEVARVTRTMLASLPRR